MMAERSFNIPANEQCSTHFHLTWVSWNQIDHQISSVDFFARPLMIIGQRRESRCLLWINWMELYSGEEILKDFHNQMMTVSLMILFDCDCCGSGFQLDWFLSNTLCTGLDWFWPCNKPYCGFSYCYAELIGRAIGSANSLWMWFWPMILCFDRANLW
jgi:hypothetical protein